MIAALAFGGKVRSGLPRGFFVVAAILALGSGLTLLAVAGKPTVIRKPDPVSRPVLLIPDFDNRTGRGEFTSLPGSSRKRSARASMRMRPASSSSRRAGCVPRSAPRSARKAWSQSRPGSAPTTCWPAASNRVPAARSARGPRGRPPDRQRPAARRFAWTSCWCGTPTRPTYSPSDSRSGCRSPVSGQAPNSRTGWPTASRSPSPGPKAGAVRGRGHSSRKVRADGLGWVSPRPRTARRFAPAIETPLRARSARRRVPMGRYPIGPWA